MRPLKRSTVGLRRFRPGQPMLDAQLFAELVELVVTGGPFGSRPEQPVGELLTIIGEQGPDTDRAGLVQVAQEAPGRGGALVGADLDVDPAGGPVDGDKQIPPTVLISHLREVLHVDMQVAGVIGLEGLRWPPWLRLGGGPGNPVALEQPVDRRAGGVLVEELAGDGEHVLQGQPQRSAQGHHHRLLLRHQGRAQPVSGVRAIFGGSAFAPAADGVFGDPELPGQLPDRLVRGLDGSPTGRRGARVLVQPDVHQARLRSWSRKSRITARLMTSA